MKGLRKILRVSWTAKKTNERVLNKAGVKTVLLDRAVSVSVFLSRYRFSVFWSVFSKVGIGFGFGFSKYRDIGFGFQFFRTNLPLLIE